MKEETYMSANTKHWRDILRENRFDFESVVEQAEHQDVAIIKIVFIKKECDKD